MTEAKQPEKAATLTKKDDKATDENVAAQLKAAAKDEVAVPLELTNGGGSIVIVVEDGIVTMHIDAVVAHEIGAYRNCKKVRVKFQEGGNMQILPIMK